MILSRIFPHDWIIKVIGRLKCCVCQLVQGLSNAQLGLIDVNYCNWWGEMPDRCPGYDYFYHLRLTKADTTHLNVFKIGCCIYGLRKCNQILTRSGKSGRRSSLILNKYSFGLAIKLKRDVAHLGSSSSRRNRPPLIHLLLTAGLCVVVRSSTSV